MSTVNEKMTALADEVRTLSGTQNSMGIDDMTTNVGSANEEVASQTALLNQAIIQIRNKAAGSGSGGITLSPIDDVVEGKDYDLVTGKQLYDDNGLIVIGTNPYKKAETDATVASQSDLLDQAIREIRNKAAGSGDSGSGSPNSPYAYAQEFLWTAPSDIKNNESVTIAHSLGVEPDGFSIMSMELECNRTEYVVNSISLDRSWYHSALSSYLISIPSFNNANNVGLAYWGDATFSNICSSSGITIGIYDLYGTSIIPAGKQYRVLVYKR